MLCASLGAHRRTRVQHLGDSFAVGFLLVNQLRRGGRVSDRSRESLFSRLSRDRSRRPFSSAPLPRASSLLSPDRRVSEDLTDAYGCTGSRPGSSRAPNNGQVPERRARSARLAHFRLLRPLGRAPYFNRTDKLHSGAFTRARVSRYANLWFTLAAPFFHGTHSTRQYSLMRTVQLDIYI